MMSLRMLKRNQSVCPSGCSRCWFGFQITDYVSGFIHPSDITIFTFDAQTRHLAFAAASNQLSIVGGVKHNFFERNFQIIQPKRKADVYAIRASTEIVQLVSLYLIFVPHLQLLLIFGTALRNFYLDNIFRLYDWASVPDRCQKFMQLVFRVFFEENRRSGEICLQ
jgi:hypothetical protein